jgi:hypothetical protein
MIGEKAQTIAHARPSFVGLHPAALGRDTCPGQAEAGGGDAADIAAVFFVVRRAVGFGAVSGESVIGIAEIPEELEGAALQVLQEPIIRGRDRRLRP